MSDDAFDEVAKIDMPATHALCVASCRKVQPVEFKPVPEASITKPKNMIGTYCFCLGCRATLGTFYAERVE